MKSWKTTASGILAALPQVLVLFPQIGLPMEAAQGISALGLFLIGLFSKDSDVTGGTKQQ